MEKKPTITFGLVGYSNLQSMLDLAAYIEMIPNIKIVYQKQVPYPARLFIVRVGR